MIKKTLSSTPVIMLIFSAVVLSAPIWFAPMGANYPDLLQKFAIFGIFAVGHTIILSKSGNNNAIVNSIKVKPLPPPSPFYDSSPCRPCFSFER